MSAFERTLKRHLVSYRMDRVLDARTTYSLAAAPAACWSAFNSRAVGAAACRAEAICVCAGTHCSRRICNDPWLELLALVEIAEWERKISTWTPVHGARTDPNKSTQLTTRSLVAGHVSVTTALRAPIGCVETRTASSRSVVCSSRTGVQFRLG